MTRRLQVFMNDQRVGRLERSTAGALTFVYDDSWLESPFARPVSLSMPITRVTYRGKVVANFFENLLPDNAEIRERLRNRFACRSTEAFDLLEAIGRDCIGALRLLPEGADESERGLSEPLSEAEIAKMLRSYRDSPLGLNPGVDEEFRISLAGAQEKTALHRIGRAWHRPRGAMPTTHILKLPIGPLGAFRPDLSDSVENEWLCLRIFAAYGLAVPNAEILDIEDIRVLAVERFDRRRHRDQLLRLPHEDLCQALAVPPDRKYESEGGPGVQQILDFLLGSESPYGDQDRFLAAVLLNWLLAAPDAHAKNYSIAIRQGGRFRLAPFYDVISVYPYFEARTANPKKQRLAMAARGKNAHYRWDEIRARHWFAMSNDKIN